MRSLASAILLLVSLAALPTGVGAAGPGEVQASGVTVEQAWARATPGNTPTGGAYVTLRNAGSTADRLIGARTPAAGKAELHTHQKDGEIMRMRAIDAIDLPAGASVAMGPGGLHIMLLDLKAPLKQGERLPLTLRFEKAGEVAVEARILGVGAAGPGDAAPTHPAPAHPAPANPGHGHGG